MSTQKPFQSLIRLKVGSGETELTEHDLRHVIGGVVAGESIERDHKDGTGSSPPKPATRYPAGSSWLGSKI